MYIYVYIYTHMYTYSSIHRPMGYLLEDQPKNGCSVRFIRIPQSFDNGSCFGLWPPKGVLETAQLSSAQWHLFGPKKTCHIVIITLPILHAYIYIYMSICIYIYHMCIYICISCVYIYIHAYIMCILYMFK